MSRYFDWTTSLKRFVRFDTARAEDVNDAFDELSAGLDGADVDIDRALKFPSGSNELLADAATRAGKVLSFDPSGNPRVTIAELDLSAALAAASAAGVSAAAASGSAADASGFATAASGSASASAASAAAAAASYDQFDDRYLGAKAADPSVDNDGAALTVGVMYFNTTSGKMRVYGALGWTDPAAPVNGTAIRVSFTATASQTIFVMPQAYEAGFADAYLNGVKLVNGVDVDVSSGTNIVLVTGASAGDSLDVIAYGSFSVANVYSQAEVNALLAAKQSTLVSGTNIKTIGGQSVLGSGDMLIQGTPDFIIQSQGVI